MSTGTTPPQFVFLYLPDQAHLEAKEEFLDWLQAGVEAWVLITLQGNDFLQMTKQPFSKTKPPRHGQVPQTGRGPRKALKRSWRQSVGPPVRKQSNNSRQERKRFLSLRPSIQEPTNVFEQRTVSLGKTMVVPR